MNRAAVIASVCRAVDNGALSEASSLLRTDYPFLPEVVTRRSRGPLECTQVFVRDGFRDRYTGDRLVFPPVLRVLSSVLPAEFPFHPNWKTDATHPAYWELAATIDHVVPITRGGGEEESNWATTSMVRNAAKGNHILAELGWTLLPPGDLEEWDGLIRWFLGYTTSRPEVLAPVRAWHRAAVAVMARLASPGDRDG